MYLCYYLSLKEIIHLLFKTRKSFLVHRPDKELGFVLLDLPPSSPFLLYSLEIKITALLLLKSLNTGMEGFVIYQWDFIHQEIWCVGIRQRALSGLLTASYHMSNLNHVSNCRNSLPSSVSQLNYTKGLSFFFSICQCFDSTLLKINFTSNMAHLFMIHLD